MYKPIAGLLGVVGTLILAGPAYAFSAAHPSIDLATQSSAEAAPQAGIMNVQYYGYHHGYHRGYDRPHYYHHGYYRHDYYRHNYHRNAIVIPLPR